MKNNSIMAILKRNTLLVAIILLILIFFIIYIITRDVLISSISGLFLFAVIILIGNDKLASSIKEDAKNLEKTQIEERIISCKEQMDKIITISEKVRKVEIQDKAQKLVKICDNYFSKIRSNLENIKLSGILFITMERALRIIEEQIKGLPTNKTDATFSKDEMAVFNALETAELVFTDNYNRFIANGKLNIYDLSDVIMKMQPVKK